METNGIMIAWNGMIMDAAISAKNTLENYFFNRVKNIPTMIQKLIKRIMKTQE